MVLEPKQASNSEHLHVWLSHLQCCDGDELYNRQREIIER